MDENLHKDKNWRQDKIFTKNFIGGGSNFHGEKLTPENVSQENCSPEICPRSPKEKKEKKENRLQKILSLT